MTRQVHHITAVIFLVSCTLLTGCGAQENADPVAATPPTGAAPAGEVLRPGHLGRTSGDLGRMVHFYHDLLGADLAGNGQPPRFFTSQPLIDFVSSPPQAEFRAINMPVPGTSIDPGTVPELVVEVIEFRNIDRHQYLTRLQDAGVSNLKLLVRNLDPVLEKLKAEGMPIVTAGGEPVSVAPLPGITGTARAIIVRDPDGYPVELVELSPTPQSNAPASSNIVGAHVSLVVDDIDASLNYYRHLVGPDLQTWAAPGFTLDVDYNKLRNTPNAERRLATMLIPGANVVMELIEYRGIDVKPYRPVIQDIGVGHVAFMVADMDLVMQRLGELGRTTLGRNGSWYHLNPNTRALYTQDPDGFFLEIMENRPAPQ
jgi:catechol 2,3-dioxygenase-like lactoylglutathione lyase family enzyme